MRKGRHDLTLSSSNKDLMIYTAAFKRHEQLSMRYIAGAGRMLC